jgi:tetratricopeptide (TPR) repeat protein
VSTKPGPFNLGETIQQALALHQQGRLDEAEKLYTRVLKAQRDNFDALHLLGMLNHQRGRAGEAYRLINAALKVQPRSPDALSNLALVLHSLKRSSEALASLDKALTIAPGHLDALNNRGNLLLDLKRPSEAGAASIVASAAFWAVLFRRGRPFLAGGEVSSGPAWAAISAGV